MANCKRVSGDFLGRWQRSSYFFSGSNLSNFWGSLRGRGDQKKLVLAPLRIRCNLDTIRGLTNEFYWDFLFSPLRENCCLISILFLTVMQAQSSLFFVVQKKSLFTKNDFFENSLNQVHWVHWLWKPLIYVTPPKLVTRIASLDPRNFSLI